MCPFSLIRLALGVVLLTLAFLVLYSPLPSKAENTKVWALVVITIDSVVGMLLIIDAVKAWLW